MERFVEECQKLQSTLGPAGQTIRQFLAAYPDAQVQLSPLVEELLRLPNVVIDLERSAADCEPEQGLLLMIRGVPEVCIENIGQIEKVLADPSRHGRETLRTFADQATTLASFLETARRTSDLAVHALDLVKSLRRAEQAGETPPYATNAILQEIASIQQILNEQSTSEQNARTLRQLHALEQNGSRVNITQLQSITLGGFLNFLKSYFEGQSLTVPASEVARRSFVAGDTIPVPPSAPDAEIDTRHVAPNLLPASPSATFRHIGKVVMNLEKEPLDIAFLAHREPTFAVSSFHNNVVLMNAATTERKKAIKVKGVHVVCSPVSDLMALTTEHYDEAMRGLKVLPLSHDFVHFEKPALYVLSVPPGDWNMTRRFMLQWHGIRAFSWSPDGSLLAIKGVRNRVEVVTSTRGIGYGIVRSHTDEVTHAEFTAGGERLVTMSRDGTLRVTQVATMHSVAKLEMENWRNPLQLAVSPAGVVASIWGRTVTIWDYETGALNSYNFEMARGSEGFPLAISPDLRWIVSRTDEGADVTDLATGKVVYSARFEAGFVSSAAFSRDGKYLVTGRCTNGHHTRTDSGILNMWEIQT